MDKSRKEFYDNVFSILLEGEKTYNELADILKMPASAVRSLITDMTKDYYIYEDKVNGKNVIGATIL